MEMGSSTWPSGEAARTSPTPAARLIVASAVVLTKQPGAPGNGTLGNPSVIPKTPTTIVPGANPEPSTTNPPLPTVGCELVNAVPIEPDEGVGGSSCSPDHPNPTNRLSHPFTQPSTHELTPLQPRHSARNPHHQTHRSPTTTSQAFVASPHHAPNLLLTTRRSTRRCQLRHIERQPHRPQHSLNRVRILDRGQ
jgi:hypothetical protein